MKDGFKLLGHLTSAFGGRAINFCNDGGKHRRARRHLDHFDVGIKARADCLQCRAHPGSNVMTLVVAMMLVEQVNLNITDMAAGAQIVLTHQAVEVNRRGGTRVGLIILYLRHCTQEQTQLLQHSSRALHRGACGHINNDLKLRFVIERQHFQYNPAKHRHQDRRPDQREDNQPHDKAVTHAFFLIKQRGKNTFKKEAETALNGTAMGFGSVSAFRLRAFHPQTREPGRHHKRNGQRQQHTHTGVDRNRAHIRAHQTGYKGHGQQGGDDRECGQNGRASDFIDGPRNNVFQCFIRVEILMAMYVLDHHDGVIHQNADGENQCEQRYPVEGKAPGPGGKQSDGQG